MRDSRSKEYMAFHNMKRRTRPSTESDVRRFGGSIWDGMDVEPDFLAPGGFQAFLDEVGRAPGPEYLLDRIDNDLGYVRGNLTWSTPSESNMNKRSANMITAFGRTQNLAAWAREYGISPSILWQRIHSLAWDPEDALTRPSQRKRQL